jgi:tripartite-type tricarboxylate transporter receptor subunit TctC
VASPVLYSKLPYDPVKDFVGTTPLAEQLLVLLVGPRSGIAGVSELVAVTKANPGEIKFASPGTGTIAHLTAEKFKSAAKST